MIIGLDVGGTHTDVVLIGPEGLIREVKVSTDSTNLFQTVLDGLEGVTVGIDPQDVHRVVLSTTLTTNMVVQQKLPPVGMIAAGGPGIDPELFRTNEHYHVVDGAMDHRGREIRPLNEERIRFICGQLRAQGIRYAGAVSKFSVRNPQHEKLMADIMTPYFERVFLGHQFSGTLNFPRRIATTYLNAAVYPIHKEFFEAVQKSLARKGLTVPIRILRPDGGNMSFDSSIDYPAQTILSGPSASVMGAVAYAPDNDATLVLDIGGTTTDMALMINAVPLLAPLGIELGTYKTLIRALQTQSIGVGGDSAVRLNGRDLRIGPDRLGCAMAYGGPAPTPTDAFCVLGLSETGDRNRAAQGLTPIAESLGVTVEQAATRIFDATCELILASARDMVDRISSKPVYTVHEVYEGHRIKPGHVLVLGGPAPQFARKLESLFDGNVRVVPHWKVANAIGCALARTTSEVTLFADTAQQMATAPGEHFSLNISPDFNIGDARKMALRLLKQKAMRRGANPDHLQMEVIEESQFNMIRGFHTIGRNIRVRVQIKPGLIAGYDPKTERLDRKDL
jgi:N-methylhydantoinase A/oxoprolinase/acetone carboxylase beta subunit